MNAPAGADDLVLSIDSGRREGHAIRLPRDIPRIVIGNRKSAHISIRDPWISWDHAALEWKDGALVIADLGSSNGTYVNKERVNSPRPLAAGDRIAFAKTLATVVLASSLAGRSVEDANRAVVEEPNPAGVAESKGCMSVVLVGAGALGAAGWWLA